MMLMMRGRHGETIVRRHNSGRRVILERGSLMASRRVFVVTSRRREIGVFAVGGKRIAGRSRDKGVVGRLRGWYGAYRGCPPTKFLSLVVLAPGEIVQFLECVPVDQVF